MSSLSDTQNSIVIITGCVTSSLSILSIICLNLLYFTTAQNKRFSNKLIILLSYFIAIKNIAFFFTTLDSLPSFCWLQSFIMISVDFFVIIVCFFLCHYCFIHIVNKDNFVFNRRLYMFLFITISVFLPIILGLFPTLTGVVGSSGPWCFIKNSNTEFSLKNIEVKVVLFLYTTWWFFLVLIIFLLVKINQINQQLKKSQVSAFFSVGSNKEVIDSIKLYSYAIIATMLPGTINRLYSLFNSNESFFVFWLQVVAENILGVLFFTIYIYHFDKNDFLSIFKTEKERQESNMDSAEVLHESPWEDEEN